MREFEGQIAVVTGGTRGIGKGVAKAFLEEGAIVAATYAGNDEAARAFKEELGELGEKLLLKKFNVADHRACESFFDELVSAHGKVDILVNNAGARKDALAAAMSEDKWDSVLDVNLKGTFNMSKFAVLHMMKKRYGRIVNISSVGGSLGLPGQANYAASKAGQIAVSKSLSKEVAKRNITVNNVAPGFIQTELIEDLPADQVKEYKKQVPMRRFGDVSEVAHAVLFLASRQASYISGAVLEVSGGL